MSAQDYAALIVSVITIAAAFAATVKWLVKHYLYELKTNGGESIKDKVGLVKEQVNRLETRVDAIFELLSNK